MGRNISVRDAREREGEKTKPNGMDPRRRCREDAHGCPWRREINKAERKMGSRAKKMRMRIRMHGWDAWGANLECACSLIEGYGSRPCVVSGSKPCCVGKEG